MATIAAHGLLVALHAAAEVLDERRAAKTDGRIRAAELVGDKLEDVRALELLEVDVLGLYRERSEPSGTRGVERAYGLDLVAALEVTRVAGADGASLCVIRQRREFGMVKEREGSRSAGEP